MVTNNLLFASARATRRAQRTLKQGAPSHLRLVPNTLEEVAITSPSSLVIHPGAFSKEGEREDLAFLLNGEGGIQLSLGGRAPESLRGVPKEAQPAWASWCFDRSLSVEPHPPRILYVNKAEPPGSREGVGGLVLAEEDSRTVQSSFKVGCLTDPTGWNRELVRICYCSTSSREGTGPLYSPVLILAVFWDGHTERLGRATAPSLQGPFSVAHIGSVNKVSQYRYITPLTRDLNAVTAWKGGEVGYPVLLSGGVAGAPVVSLGYLDSLLSCVREVTPVLTAAHMDNCTGLLATSFSLTARGTQFQVYCERGSVTQSLSAVPTGWTRGKGATK